MINAAYEDLIGKPIESLQAILREIAFFYEDLPKVLPDGIFGEQTRVAVEAFQTKFGLEVTGEVDFGTWEVIIRVYYDVRERNKLTGSIYPSVWFTIGPYEESEHLKTMQSMMKNIAQRYDNLNDVEITGIHGDDSIKLVKSLQEMFGMEPTGIIDNVFWNRVESLHKNSVINRFDAEDRKVV